MQFLFITLALVALALVAQLWGNDSTEHADGMDRPEWEGR